MQPQLKQDSFDSVTRRSTTRQSCLYIFYLYLAKDRRLNVIFNPAPAQVFSIETVHADAMAAHFISTLLQSSVPQRIISFQFCFTDLLSVP